MQKGDLDMNNVISYIEQNPRAVVDKQSNIIEKVEEFIQHLHKLEYVIDLKATNMRYRDEKGLNAGSLSDLLANAISHYEEKRDIVDLNIKNLFAQMCLIWINRAFASGVVNHGEGLIAKLKECSEKNKELENELIKISEEYKYLRTEYEDIKLQNAYTEDHA